MSRQYLFAEQKVPRYTSYPTAPHFHAGIDAIQYLEWLSAIPAQATLSLYLHVPFCTSLCIYCGCHTHATRRKDPLREYVSLLHRELDLVFERTAARRVVHIHWGGGTPSAIGERALIEIVEHLSRIADLTPVHEHAIELDPRHVRAELVHTLSAIGVNRASLGVQEFAPHVQAAMGRRQPLATVQRAVDRLCGAGIRDLNFDLMYGLPCQTEADTCGTIDRAVALNPQRLAVFGYAHVPWFRPRQRLINEADLPGVAERFSQMQAARQQLHRHGYEAIGLDHFARPTDELVVARRAGRLRRNFQGYTADNASVLIGIGCSSIGRLPHAFVQNATELSDYAQRINADRPATVRGIELTDDDRTRGEIIESLMCYLQAELPADWLKSLGQCTTADALDLLEREGLVRRAGNLIMVPEGARPFVRLVAAAFDAYLPNTGTRHAAAI